MGWTQIVWLEILVSILRLCEGQIEVFPKSFVSLHLWRSNSSFHKHFVSCDCRHYLKLPQQIVKSLETCSTKIRLFSRVWVPRLIYCAVIKLRLHKSTNEKKTKENSCAIKCANYRYRPKLWFLTKSKTVKSCKVHIGSLQFAT